MKFNDFLKLASRPRKRKNRQLMLAVASRLRKLRHEKHYNQAVYVTQNACGTTCCIAGYAVLEAGCAPADLVPLERSIHADFEGESRYLDIGDAAQNLLGLDDDERAVLFSSDPSDDDGWPEPYATRFKKACRKNATERPPRVAADLLEAVANGKVKLAWF